MPIDTHTATKIWNRYAWVRDNGHALFVEKADLCEAFFRGDQWTAEDKTALRRRRVPALTINKILPTIANVMGEQIHNRSEISFRPRTGAPSEVADTLSKVFKQISDNNQLDWKRSDMFADGIITSRGYLDVRIDFDDQMQGEVRITGVNPKNVIPDPDAEDMDPDTWSEVFVTKWVTADDIAVMYNEDDAEQLRGREASAFPYGYDLIQFSRDRIGGPRNPAYRGVTDETNVMRNLRLIERQYRKLDRQKHFVSVDGDTRPIPAEFDRNRIALFVDNFGFKVIEKLVRRIKWTCLVDNVVLHDDWSPYDRFTIVPYFPHFRHGATVGLVENLLGSQELLNKTSSQELHVVNTTANSGYKVRAGALTNMTVSELEEKGAQTGVVIEVNGDPDKDLQKIQPNQVPQGLDRISYKAEEHIKTISGVNDSMQGMDREDVAAKAIQAKRQAGSTNLVKPLDSLVRTDYILARNVLGLVQRFYTEERLMTITKDPISGDTESFAINQPTPEGYIINDLTLGEYDVVISSVPQRETLEDSQFEQAMALREAGIPIPDETLIQASRLRDKKAIIQSMRGDQDSPEAQAARELQQRGAEAEVSKTEGEAAQKHADALLKQAKAQKEGVATQKEAMTPIEQEQGDGGAALIKTHADIDLNERKFAHQQQIDFAKLQMERQKQQDDTWLKAKDDAEKRANERVAQARQAAQASTDSQPTSKE